MRYTVSVESLPEKNYLAIKGFVELGGSTPDAYAVQERILSERIFDGSIERLRKASGSVDVYIVFLLTCELDGNTGGYICGHDIACENVNNAKPGIGFDTIRLEPSEYAVFDCTADHGMTIAQANKRIDDIYWGEWLKNNPYESSIETDTGANTPGIACIGRIDPLDPNAKSFRIKIWFPVKPKEKTADAAE